MPGPSNEVKALLDGISTRLSKLVPSSSNQTVAPLDEDQKKVNSDDACNDLEQLFIACDSHCNNILLILRPPVDRKGLETAEGFAKKLLDPVSKIEFLVPILVEGERAKRYRLSAYELLLPLSSYFSSLSSHISTSYKNPSRANLLQSSGLIHELTEKLKDLPRTETDAIQLSWNEIISMCDDQLDEVKETLSEFIDDEEDEGERGNEDEDGDRDGDRDGDGDEDDQDQKTKALLENGLGLLRLTRLLIKGVSNVNKSSTGYGQLMKISKELVEKQDDFVPELESSDEESLLECLSSIKSLCNDLATNVSKLEGQPDSSKKDQWPWSCLEEIETFAQRVSKHFVESS